MRVAKLKASDVPSADLALSEIGPLLVQVPAAGKAGLSVKELETLEGAGNWTAIQELAADALARAKDLEAAGWWVLSAVYQRGFPGARNGLLFLKGLLEQFWDHGLQPAEAEERGVALRWLNRRFAEALGSLMVTERSDWGTDYSLEVYKDADKRSIQEQKLGAKMPSRERWEEAVAATEGSFYASMLDFTQKIAITYGEIDVLLKVKLGSNAPDLQTGSSQIVKLVDVAERTLRTKGLDSSSQGSVLQGTAETGEASQDAPPSHAVLSAEDDSGNNQRVAWDHAVQSAQSNLSAGLAKMRTLASAEPAGRDLFYRKLSLAKIYLDKRKTQPAQIILEELAREIDERKLFEWESLSSIAEVWNKLCECRIETGDSEGAGKLFERLCKLAPWHAAELGKKDA